MCSSCSRQSSVADYCTLSILHLLLFRYTQLCAYDLVVFMVLVVVMVVVVCVCVSVSVYVFLMQKTVLSCRLGVMMSSNLSSGDYLSSSSGE